MKKNNILILILGVILFPSFAFANQAGAGAAVSLGIILAGVILPISFLNLIGGFIKLNKLSFFIPLSLIVIIASLVLYILYFDFFKEVILFFLVSPIFIIWGIVKLIKTKNNLYLLAFPPFLIIWGIIKIIKAENKLDLLLYLLLFGFFIFIYLLQSYLYNHKF